MEAIAAEVLLGWVVASLVFGGVWARAHRDRPGITNVVPVPREPEHVQDVG